MSEHLNLLKSVLIFTNPKGQHNSSLAYQKMDEVQYQTSIYVATEDIPAGVAISDARWAKKLDNSTAYQAELARQTAEGEREQAEDSRETAEGLREQGEIDRGNAYSQAELARDGLYATAESARDDLFTGSQQDRTSAYNLRENQRDSAYDAAELARGGLYEAAESARDGLYQNAEASREQEFDAAEIARNQTLAEGIEAGRLNYKGPHDPDTEYSFNNWVTDSGSSYAYINPTPSTGVPLSDTSHWQQIATIGGQDLVDAAVAARDAAQAQAALAQGYAAQLAAGLTSPGVYATFAALVAAKPTGDTKIYVVTSDGYWYYWDGSAWVAGGVYQAASVAEDIEAIRAETLITQELESTGFNYGVIRVGDSPTVDLEAAESSPGWVHKIVACRAGDTIKITGSGGSSARLWAKIASDGTVLSRAGVYASATDLVLPITEDCFFLFNADTANNYEITGTIRKNVNDVLREGFDDFGSRLASDETIELDAFNAGAIPTYLAIGQTVSYSAGADTSWGHVVLNCKSGMTFKIKGKGGYNSLLWCFVDNDDKVVSRSENNKTDDEVTATVDGKIIINVMTLDASPSVEYTPYDINSIVGVVSDIQPRLKNIENRFDGVLNFGLGIDCNYTTPVIDALSVPAIGSRLDYFYGLYDELANDYPEYITKIDCDAEVGVLGIVQPENLANYPIYMYKFVPTYTPSSSDPISETLSSRLKVMVTTGTHCEYMAIWDMYQTMRLVCESWKTDANLEALRWECEFYIIPCSNPFGVDNNTRTNVNDVDLNRNCPTSDWVLRPVGSTYSGPSAGSEYETKVLVHYLESIAPHIFIDHHNFFSLSGAMTYGAANAQPEIDILSRSISWSSRKWKQRYPSILPQNDTLLFGWARYGRDPGTRSRLGYEKGARSCTYESSMYVEYENNEFSSVAHNADEVATTIATDGFLNFLLINLKLSSDRLSSKLYN